MSKVTLTKGQAKAIENAKITVSDDNLVIEKVKSVVNFDKFTDPGLIELNELTTDTLIKALYIGYEVEPEFKKDDWVHVSFKSGSKIAKILNSYHEVIQFYDNENLPNIKVDNQTRHATPEEIAEEKQRRFWYENGREVGEFKKNDILSVEGANYAYTISKVLVGKGNNKLYKIDEDSARYTKEMLLKGFVVACFAHDRKDIKNA